MSNYINAILDSVNENNSVELFNSAIVNEILLYSDNGDNYSLHIDPDETHKEIFINDPYIKVYDNVSFRKAKSSIRVHIFTRRYEYHRDGLKHLKYSMSIANFLNTAMQMQSINKDYPGTVYEAIISIIESKYGLNPDESDILRSRKLIDFREIL